MTKKLTDKQSKFIELLPTLNMNVSECCKQLNIGRSTYYEWLDKSDTFKQKRDDAQESLYDLVEDKIYEQIKGGNTTMLIFFAKTKMKRRGYVETQQIENISDEPMVINFTTAKPVGEIKVTKGKG